MLRAACAGTKAISPASSSVYYGQSWIPNSTRLKPLLHMHWCEHKCLDFLKLFCKLELREQQVGAENDHFVARWVGGALQISERELAGR